MHLRGCQNVLKRVLIYVGALNLSLVMRKLWGKGTPRGWQGYSADAVLTFLRFWMAILAQAEEPATFPRPGDTRVANASCNFQPARRAVSRSLLPRAASLAHEDFSGTLQH